MANSRDELLADWQHKLVAAECLAADSPRAAWLAQVRIRLYRFLLRCYGSGPWNAAPASSRPATPASPGVEGPLSAQLDLDGKPARSGAKIAAVLKSVAGAQAAMPAAGPLAGGLADESWVIVAAASSKLKVVRCHMLLRAAGLHPRRRYRGDDHMVEVPAHERHEAFAVVERAHQQLTLPKETPRTQRIPLWARFSAGGLLALWSAVPLAWLVVLSFSDPRPPLQLALESNGVFFRLWGSLFVVGLLLVCLDFARRARPPRKLPPR